MLYAEQISDTKVQPISSILNENVSSSVMGSSEFYSDFYTLKSVVGGPQELDLVLKYL